MYGFVKCIGTQPENNTEEEDMNDDECAGLGRNLLRK